MSKSIKVIRQVARFMYDAGHNVTLIRGNCSRVVSVGVCMVDFGDVCENHLQDALHSVDFDVNDCTAEFEVDSFLLQAERFGCGVDCN